jgi:hypothetical protein
VSGLPLRRITKVQTAQRTEGNFCYALSYCAQ